MTTKRPHDEGFGTAEFAARAEADRLLPAPAHPDLLDDRLRVLKEHLMSEIQHTKPAAGPEAATADTVPASRRRVRRWTLIITPLAAAAVAAAVLTAPGYRSEHRDVAEQATSKALLHSPSHRSEHGTVEPAPSQASLLLQNAADVVSRSAAVPVGHDQLVYIRSVKIGNGLFAEAPGKLRKPMNLQEWIPWSQHQAGAVAYGDSAPSRLNFPAPGTGMAMDPPYILIPLKNLAALPRDPDKALATIKTQIARQTENDYNTDGGRHHDDVSAPTLFQYLGGMFQESVDPQTTAFLYRVAARIPGTTVVPEAVDATGRHGVAITLDGGNEDRQEWIFDKSTYAFLGFRDVMQHDTANGKAGTVISVTAVLGRAVVDHAGDTSGKTAG